LNYEPIDEIVKKLLAENYNAQALFLKKISNLTPYIADNILKFFRKVMDFMEIRHIKNRYLNVEFFVSIVAIALSVFHLKAAIFGPPEELLFRAVHLGFVSVILFLRPQQKTQKKLLNVRLFNMVLAAIAAASIIYLLYDYDHIINRFTYIDPLKNLEIIFGISLVLIVLEGARRTTGPTLPILALLFISYALFGNYFPGGLKHQGLSIAGLIEQMYLLPDGVLGIPLGVSAKYLVIFLLFGAFLEQAGAGTFFTDFASSLVGRTRGGAAKVAVVASSFFGTISGAPTANVMVTGTFTIPAMMRVGFRPEVAGAIEATSSVGGALMPPVLGATAFIIVEFTGYQYLDVIKWTFLPALLYYTCIYSTVHLEAIKFNISFSNEKIKPFAQVIREQGLIFVPIVVLIYLILTGHSPSFAVWVSITAIIITSWLRPATRIGIKKFLAALEKGGKNVTSVAMACACAGIITGVILLTGVGMAVTSLFLRLSGGSLFILLILVIFPLLILGLGMPAAPAYIICASIFAPAMVKAGLSIPAAHIFIYYYALLSSISPPVAMAAFAASSISGASPIKTGFWAVRTAAVAYILPFSFAFSPELLMMGSPFFIVIAFMTAIIGVMSMVCGLQGFILRPLYWPLRLLLIAVSILMIFPGLATDIAGITVLSIILTHHIVSKKSIQPKTGGQIE